MTLAFIQGIGPTELIIVLVIVLLIFGPKRLPSLARSMGSGIRELKDSVAGKDDDDDTHGSGAQGEARSALARPEEPVAGTPRVTADDRPVEGEVVPDRR